MQGRWGYAAVAVLAVFVQRSAAAEIPTPSELLDLIAGNPRLSIAAADTDIAEARLAAAMAALRPRLDAQVNARRMSSMNPRETRDSDVFSHLEVIQPIYDFGRSSSKIAAARAETEAAEAAARSVRDALMLEGLALYYELHASDLEVQALQEENTIAFFRFSRLQEKDAVGAANPILLLELQGRAEKARYDYYRAQSHNAELRLRLAELTGAPFKTSTLTPAPAETGPFELDVAALIARAETALPALEELRRHRAALEARRGAGGLTPRIEAYGRLGESTRNLRGRDDWALGARFVLPLYHGGIEKSDQAKLAAEIKQADSRIQLRRQALSREVSVAVMHRSDAWRRTVAAKTAYKAARRKLYLEQLQRNQDQQGSIGGESARVTRIEAELVRAIGAYAVSGARLATLLGEHPVRGLAPDFLEDLKVVEE